MREEVLKRIGKTLMQIRKSKGINTIQIHQMSGIPVDGVKSVEKGISKRIDYYISFALGLGCKIVLPIGEVIIDENVVSIALSNNDMSDILLRYNTLYKRQSTLQTKYNQLKHSSKSTETTLLRKLADAKSLLIEQNFNDDSYKEIDIKLVQFINKYYQTDLTKRCRKAIFVRARHTFFNLIRKHTNLSLYEMSINSGHHDHSTIISGIKRADAWIKFDPKYREEYAEIEKYFVNTILKNEK